MSGKQIKGEDECKAKRRTFIDGHHLEYLCRPFFTRHERDIVLKLNSEQEPLRESGLDWAAKHVDNIKYTH